MRLPWTQVANEVVEHDAAHLAAMLDWREDSAGWGLLKLFHWSLRQAREDMPPSLSAFLPGKDAAKVVARIVGWRKDPARLMEALERLPDPPAVRTRTGVLLHGLSRYDAAWGKSHPELWKEWKGILEKDRTVYASGPSTSQDSAEPVPEPVQVRAETVPEPARVRTGTGPEPALQTQTQTQKETLKKETNERPSKDFVPRLPEKPTKAAELWDGLDFWAWAQFKRHEAGLAVEKKPNERNLSAWFSSVLMQGFTAADLEQAFYGFGEDPYWKDPQRTPRVPFAGFMEQWERYTAKGVHRAAS